MDMSAYKKEFISEARDHLDTINECLLILEKDSTNEETINKCFRSYHTLKGNSATMGFTKFSHLAHDLEDILGKIRDKAIVVNAELMGILFKGCDLLDEGLTAIDEDRADDIEIEDLINDVKRILNIKEEKIDVKIGENAVFGDDEKKKIEEQKSQGKNLYRVVISFKEGSRVVKSAKAQLILKNISTEMIIKANPSVAEIKTNKFDLVFELLLATSKTKEELSKAINMISGLENVFILSLEDKYEKPKPVELVNHEEKEAEKHAITTQHKESMTKQIQSVKVDIKRLDSLMNMVGELLINNLRLNQITKKYEDKELTGVISGNDRLSTRLQEEIMQVRMVPIGNIFNRFPRMVRDLAIKENKKVSLVVEGEEIEFDRTILDEIGEPLVHMLRNCVDHGVETVEERRNAGKPEEGVVRLIARREKNNAIVEVSDDGAGIDPKIVKEAAIRKGKITEEEASKLTNEQLQMLIFRPGMSTNKVVTEVSGRGVGMDVVVTKTKALGGTMKLDSVVGKGTKVTLYLPLTVAIVTCLMVEINKSTYAIPLNSIERTVEVRKEEIKTVQGHETFILRNRDIPLFWLHSLFNEARQDTKKFDVVIIDKDSEKIGLVVDRVITQQQILIKSLDKMVKGTKGIGGATILGDGSVSLILDVGTLL